MKTAIYTLLGFAVLLSTVCLAKAHAPVSKKTPTEYAINTFKKLRKNVTTLSMDCVSFLEEGPVAGKSDMDINVLEKHNAKCGGDPQTAPTVAQLRVKDTKVFIMDFMSGDYKIFDSKYKPNQ